VVHHGIVGFNSKQTHNFLALLFRQMETRQSNE